MSYVVEPTTHRPEDELVEHRMSYTQATLDEDPRAILSRTPDPRIEAMALFRRQVMDRAQALNVLHVHGIDVELTYADERRTVVAHFFPRPAPVLKVA